MVTNFKTDPFMRYSVGFDRLFNELERTSLTTQNNYPPFNIIREDDSFYRIEVAVSGFSEDELSIELKESTLTVSGTVAVSDIEAEYLHKGISSRDFERNFTSPIKIITLLSWSLSLRGKKDIFVMVLSLPNLKTEENSEFAE